MDKVKYNTKVICFLSKIRILSDTHLFSTASYIPHDILVAVTLHTLREAPPPIKVLFASLKHSESGIRYHLDRLIEAGWIELIPCEKDQRVKLCVIGESYKHRVAKYLAEVERLAYELTDEISAHKLANTGQPHNPRENGLRR